MCILSDPASLTYRSILWVTVLLSLKIVLLSVCWYAIEIIETTFSCLLCIFIPFPYCFPPKIDCIWLNLAKILEHFLTEIAKLLPKLGVFVLSLDTNGDLWRILAFYRAIKFCWSVNILANFTASFMLDNESENFQFYRYFVWFFAEFYQVVNFSLYFLNNW